MPKTNSSDEVPANNSVKLSPELLDRVKRAMRAKGSTVFADFFRVSLTNECRATEEKLKRENPDEYQRIYGEGSRI